MMGTVVVYSAVLWIGALIAGSLAAPNFAALRQPPTKRGPQGQTIMPFYAASYPYSNHYEADITIDGVTFMTTEHYYFYKKALIFDEPKLAQAILHAPNPQAAKQLGNSRMPKFNKQNWDAVSYQIMKRAIFEKFKQYKPLRKYLLQSGNAVLVEAAPKDVRWGVGMPETHPDIANPAKWRGTNFLGRALMEVRSGMRNGWNGRAPDIGHTMKGSDGKTYRVFHSKYNILHNFYPTEFLYLEGINFASAQHYFTYKKATTFGDKRTAQRILAEHSPTRAQHLGFEVKGFQKSKWDNGTSYKHMRAGVLAKFQQNEYMKKILKETGTDVLVFADASNPWWSSGLWDTDSNNAEPAKWKGQNQLGKLLMEVRSQL